MKRKKNIYESPIMDVLFFELKDVVTLSSPAGTPDVDGEIEDYEDLFG